LTLVDIGLILGGFQGPSALTQDRRHDFFMSSIYVPVKVNVTIGWNASDSELA